ncbi:LOW QUALITY PROTEIN: nischarin-like [Argopecten irradians]|uniref:LOW QUALITY PROTEIN: nischarin-like n=1 Tax=Argopecten irradians TaxID=31199 RepID=UPI00371D9810
MAHFGKDLDHFSSSRTVRIKGSETEESHTVYTVEVSVGSYTWTVKHRYNDFLMLHEKLVSICKIDKTLLPPKKLFGNQSEGFIKKRQAELEAYLQTVLYYVAHKVPPVLAAFLEFNRYEIHGITQCMAEDLYNRGDVLLQSREMYEVTPLQLYSLTERLKLPEPTCDSGDVKKDIGHILDFITRVKYLKVHGSTDPVGTSNIDMSQLKFDLSLFKSLQCLEVSFSIALQISGIDTIKQTMDRITLHYCVSKIRVSIIEYNHIKTIQHLNWLSRLTFLDLSYNTFRSLDALHTKIGNLKTLILAGNKLDSLQGLSKLFSLENLDVSHNEISQMTEVLHVCKLPCLEELHMNNNPVTTVLDYRTKVLSIVYVHGPSIRGNPGFYQRRTAPSGSPVLPDLYEEQASPQASSTGLSKLFSLENLDVSHNEISQMTEVLHVCKLPCLEELHMNNNPVTTVLDYRTKVLSMFMDRASEVILDDHKPSQQELDTVAVLQAIQKSKENKDKSRKPITRKSISDDRPSGSPVLPDLYEEQASPQASSTGVEDSQEGRSPSQRQNSSGDFSPTSSGSWSQSLVFLQQAGPETKAPVETPGNKSYDESLGADDTVTSQKSNAEGKERRKSNAEGKERRRSRGHSDENLPVITFINIAKLPNHRNSEFVSWLQTRLFGSDLEDKVMEQIVNVMWSNVIQYSKQEVSIPCCAVLTERRLFLLRLKHGSCGFSGVPDLETFYIMPLNNVQQALAGPCYCYIRLEESFVGPSGTFVLEAADSDAGKDFTDDLQSRLHSSELGSIDIINCSQNSDISKQIFSQEDDEGLCTGRVVVSAVVSVSGTEELALLLLSENKVYLIQRDCLFWPRPSFIDKLEDIKSKPHFTYLQQHSVMTNISEIKIGLNVHRVHKHRRTSSFQSKNLLVLYEPFDVSMVFHELIGAVGFQVCFLSQKARDSFLDQLTILRSEHTHRMSPTIREEPEGGNESSDSFDAPANVPAKSKTKEQFPGLESSVEESQSTEVEVRHIRSKTIANMTLNTKVALSPHMSMKLDLNYLTPELQSQLESCIRSHNIVKSLSSKLLLLTEMKGEELAKFFHSDIALVNSESEQLHYVLWVVVVPYKDPRQEIISCVMMSSRAMYFVSDRVVKSPLVERQAWMTHTRHKSDSVIGLQRKQVDQHHSSGILHSSQKDSTIIRCYHVFHYSDLRQVNVGLFDQCVRLTGNDSNSTYTLLSRDGLITEQFMRQLTTMLTIFSSSPMVDRSPADVEQDFYRAFNKRTKTTLEGMEYLHPSKVPFIYPGEDTMSDLLYIITDRLRLSLLSRRKADILMYILCYVATSETQCGTVEIMEPRSLVLTNDYLCLMHEDVASYPLPEFARGLPNTARYHITDIHKVDSLKRVLFFRDNPQKLTLIFSEEAEEIVVDTSVEHFSADDKSGGRQSLPEVGITVLVQCDRDINKVMVLLKNQWRDIHGDELEIHIL